VRRSATELLIWNNKIRRCRESRPLVSRQFCKMFVDLCSELEFLNKIQTRVSQLSKHSKEHVIHSQPTSSQRGFSHSVMSSLRFRFRQDSFSQRTASHSHHKHCLKQTNRTSLDAQCLQSGADWQIETNNKCWGEQLKLIEEATQDIMRTYVAHVVLRCARKCFSF
jgi:hypothetical protein